MAQQTAVGWLVEQLLIYGDKAFNKEISLGEYHIKKDELIQQAKQMEKEQIMNARLSTFDLIRRDDILKAEQYYNETYRK